MPPPLPKHPHIAIILLNWNGGRDTLACLKSLEALTYPHHTILLVDNGSTDSSVASIRAQHPELKIIETGVNLGFAGGNNVGIEIAMGQGCDWLFLLNNDTVVAPDILEGFLETGRSYPAAGILGAKIHRLDAPGTLDHLGGMWNLEKGVFDFVGLRERADDPAWQEAQEIDYVCGAGLMMRREVVETIGYLDSRYFLIWEESDFCFRAQRAGFKTMTAPQAKLWHKVSASFSAGKAHSTYFWWRNRLLWIEKNCTPSQRWGLYFKVLIPDILHMLKIHLLKTAQLFLLRRFKPRLDVREKKHKLHKNRAALRGVYDYLLGRFGDAPAWVHKQID